MRHQASVLARFATERHALANRDKPRPYTRKAGQREQFRFNDNEQPMGDKQTDRIGKQHQQPAPDPVPLASDENGCELQRLDHRQRPCQNQKRRIRGNPLDLPPQAPQTLFGTSRNLLHQHRQRGGFANVRFPLFHQA